MNTIRLFTQTTLVACLLLGLLGMTGGNVQAATSSGKSSIIQGPAESLPTDRIIIKYKQSEDAFSNAEHLDQMERLSQAADVPLQYFREMSGDAHVLQLQERLPLEQVRLLAQQLMNLPEVEYAEADEIMMHTLVPNDPQYTNQWHYFESWGINLPAAWDITTGSNSIVAAVIDTGITNHADLSGRSVSGYDFISDIAVANDGNGRDNNPSDPGDWVVTNECFPGSASRNSSWHGTHVAGTIGAASNNGLGVAGVNWNSKILPVRVLGKCGGSNSDIADAMRWSAGLTVSGVPANVNPAKVLNLSLGGSGTCSATYQNAINDVTTAGAVVVISAGNSNANASGFQPANCSGVITVAATNRSGSKAFYSNFGSTVELSAPGGETNITASNGVLSTLNTGTTVPASDTYAYYQGTSMAAPHVSGVVSLVLSRNLSLTPSEVLSILQNTAKAFPGGTCNTSNCGSGIVDAGAAVNAADPTFPLTVSKTGTGTGMVTSNPAGIDCGADCSESYTSGTPVTLTAPPDPGSTFTGWSGGGCSGTGTCLVTMNAATTVIANFDLISTGGTIFNDSFESDDCTLSPWTSCVHDNFDLSFNDPPLVSPGNQSMTILIDDNNPLYVTSDHPAAETRYIASFYFDPNSITMVNGDVHTIFGGYSGTSTLVLRLQFRRSSGLYQVQAALLHDNSTWNTSSWFNISDAPHQIAFDWRAATAAGANNGGLTLWIDGVQKADKTAADNDTWRIDRAQLGAVAGIDTGTRNTYLFDEFESTRGGSQSTATLTVTKSGTGSGIVISNPVGINCGADCSEIYISGTPVTLTATADPGSAFTGWSGGGCSGAGNCVVTMNAATFVTANFDLDTGDLIFANSFEDDDCFNTQWSSCVDDGGDLQFNDPPSPLKDNASMVITIDDNNLVYLTSDHPNAEARYRARFYFDPNSISMVSGNAHFIFYGYNGTSKIVLRMEFRNSSGNYQLRAGLLNDASSWKNSTWFTIADAPHFIEFDWKAATGAGANNGYLTLWIDGTQKANLINVDNDTWRIDRARLGAIAGIDTGTRGKYYFDAFESRRQTYIGP